MSEEVIKPSSKSRYVWLSLALILLVGGGGYIASKTGLDKALIKQALDQFATNIKQDELYL
jgi:hypothetical protein